MPAGGDDSSLSSLAGGSRGRNRSPPRRPADLPLTTRGRSPSRARAASRTTSVVGQPIAVRQPSVARTLPAQSSPVSPTAFGSPQLQGPLPQPQQTTQQVTLVDPGVALNVIQAQSQQIAELVQLAKGLGELQAAAAVQKAASPIAAGSGDAPGASGSDEAAPMDVDKDTGGVRHYKAESYLPKIPMLNFEKMVTRASEISHWSEFVEGVTSWLALLGDFYPIELYRATITETVVRQDTLEKGPAARSARFHNLLKQSLGTFQRGLDIVRQAEQQQLGAACGYTSFRRLNPEFGIQSRMEATSIREALAYRPGKHLQRPLDIYRAVEAELLKADRNLHSYPSVKLSEAEKVMLHFKCMPESCKHYVLLHGKSDTLEQVLDSIKFYDSHLRLAVWTEELIAAFTRGQGKTKGKEKGKDKGKSSGKTQQDGKGKNGKGKGDGKSRPTSAAPKGRCCNEKGHFARDCPHPKRTEAERAKAKAEAKAKAKSGAQAAAMVR